MDKLTWVNKILERKEVVHLPKIAGESERI